MLLIDIMNFNFCSEIFLQKEILLQTVGSKVTPLVVNPGRIVLTDAILYFQPYNNAESAPVIKVRLDAIKRIFQRRFDAFTSVGTDAKHLLDSRGCPQVPPQALGAGDQLC